MKFYLNFKDKFILSKDLWRIGNFTIKRRNSDNKSIKIKGIITSGDYSDCKFKIIFIDNKSYITLTPYKKTYIKNKITLELYI